MTCLSVNGQVKVPAGGQAVPALSTALACGLTFVGWVFEYSALIADGHTAGANNFHLCYFILTGLHLFHVGIGLVALMLLMTQAGRSDIGATRMAVIEGGGCFCGHDARRRVCAH